MQPHTEIHAAWGPLLAIVLLIGGLMILYPLARHWPHAFAVLGLVFLGFCGLLVFAGLVLSPRVAVQNHEFVELKPPTNDRTHAVVDSAPEEIQAAEAALDKPTAPAAAKSAPTDKTVKQGWLVWADGRTERTARPAWVDQPVEHAVDGDTFITVNPGPYQTSEECRAALQKGMEAALHQYLDDPAAIGPDANRYVQLPGDYLRRKIHESVYTEKVHASVGDMLQSYARLKFDKNVRDDLTRFYHQGQSEERLRTTGMAAGGVLALLGIALVVLKRPRVTRRALATTGVALLVVAGAGILAATVAVL